MSTSDPDLRVPYGYEVVHRLGSGQTSHVHLARHARYGKVALKLPRPELEERPVLRRMFENEVMITLRLQHVRVVRGLDGHPTGTGAYLALEMCPGGTLDQHLLERGRLPLPEAIRLVTEVAEGLAYTHGRKVLHRDVKPANVFLDGDGHAKLGDFGTGVFFASDDASERVGTAFYMAPEIFEGAASDVRSDVYALGVLAYEVLTGQRPFRGDTFDALMHAHMGGLLQDPMSVRADLPKDLARTIRTALARRPDRRHADVDAFLEAWHGAGAPETTDGSATSERRSASP
ncbi:MAG: serine/threonine-protein kinase [Trueperaceae bacterium]